MSNTAEEMFKEASKVMESEVLIPIVLQKCAERGYQPQNEQEAAQILKIASDIRDGLANGQIAPVPAAYLDEQGEMSKQASAAIEEDPMAFAGPVEIELSEIADNVKEAAAVMTWGSMEAVAEQQAK